MLATDLSDQWFDGGATGVEFRRHDLVRDPVPAHSFDLVHARFLLEHLADPRRAMVRLVDALRPGGVLVLEDSAGLAVHSDQCAAGGDCVGSVPTVGAVAARSPDFGLLGSRRAGARIAYVVVLLVAGTLLLGCGSSKRSAAGGVAVASGNYDSHGVWRGERVGTSGARDCGYLTVANYTAFYVQVRGVNCAEAAGTLKAYLTGGFRPPRGWNAAVHRIATAPPGGPPGSRNVVGSVLLRNRATGAAVFSGLSHGRSGPPPPLPGTSAADNVRFGCATRSSICR